jgi:hypothetical protein
MATPTGIPLLEHFAALPDPRQHAKVLYPLPEILLLVLSATLAGADDFVETTLWGTQHLAFLRRFYRYEKGIPSHDTLCDVLAVPTAMRAGRRDHGSHAASQPDRNAQLRSAGQAQRGESGRQVGPLESAARRCAAWLCRRSSETAPVNTLCDRQRTVRANPLRPTQVWFAIGKESSRAGDRWALPSRAALQADPLGGTRGCTGSAS